MRYAIWCAVSTAAQAKDDKVSLEVQEKRCRAYGKSQKWLESAGPFIAKGYSRTGYFSLPTAAKEIPPLAELLEQIDSYDVLVMYSYDRMGDVLGMLSTYFRQYKKQILSISQLSQIHEPDTYDPHTDEGGEIMQDVARITQRFRISDLRRKWRAGIPSRIDKGLHPLAIMYGYALAGKDQPAVQVPEQIALIHQLKEWMLEGVPYAEMARRADKILPPPRKQKWSDVTIRNIVTSPYYAGLVRFGVTRDVDGRTVKNPPSQWKVGKGKHVPVWNEDTYHALVAEAKRRVEGKRYYNPRMPFSGLTVCGVCGSKVTRHGKEPHTYLVCNTTWKHWQMKYVDAEKYLTEALVKQLKEYQESPPKPVDVAPLHARLEELKELRTRVQDGYKAKLFSAEEAGKEISTIEEEGDDIARKIAKAENEEATRNEWRERMGGMKGMVEKLPVAIQHGEPRKINQLLSSMIREIIITKDKVRFVWRE